MLSTIGRRRASGLRQVRPAPPLRRTGDPKLKHAKNSFLLGDVVVPKLIEAARGHIEVIGSAALAIQLLTALFADDEQTVETLFRNGRLDQDHEIRYLLRLYPGRSGRSNSPNRPFRLHLRVRREKMTSSYGSPWRSRWLNSGRLMPCPRDRRRVGQCVHTPTHRKHWIEGVERQKPRRLRRLCLRRGSLRHWRPRIPDAGGRPLGGREEVREIPGC